MKKLLIICMICMVVPALATTICADDDVVAIVLDPEVNGTSDKVNANAFEWGATFSYGSVWGIATCLDVAGSVSVAVNDLRSGDGEPVTGGEHKGSYCWCRMTHPATSAWVFRSVRASTEVCAANCAGDCVGYVRGVYTFRMGVFGALN